MDYYSCEFGYTPNKTRIMLTILYFIKRLHLLSLTFIYLRNLYDTRILINSHIVSQSFCINRRRKTTLYVLIINRYT